MTSYLAALEALLEVVPGLVEDRHMEKSKFVGDCIATKAEELMRSRRLAMEAWLRLFFCMA